MGPLLQIFGNTLSKMSRRAIFAAGQLILQAPRLNPPSGYEVRPVEEGWMIFERGTTIPVRMFRRKLDAIREARRRARKQGTTVTVYTRTTRGPGSREIQLDLFTE